MLQLVNRTPFASAMFLFPDEHGIDTLYVAVKAAFDLSSSKPQISEKQRAVVLADEYFGDPGKSGLKYATEAHLMKPGTDVILIGDAIVPKGKTATQIDVFFSAADRAQIIRVFGDRQWKGGALNLKPGAPEPFERMPIVYERAFGGMQTILNSDSTEEVYSEPRNPVGRGFRGNRSREEIKQEPVPNLEDPERPFSSLGAKTEPVGFGFVAPSWAPRMHYAGTYDEKWQKNRAPYLPVDFDNRFFNSASLGWTFDPGLPNGAEVRVENMSPRGVLEFEVPSLVPNIEIAIADGIEAPDMCLETLLIEPNDERCFLTWRASLPCDKKALLVSEVRILA